MLSPPADRGPRRGAAPLDHDFLRRVYRTSAATALAVLLLQVAANRWDAALGWGFGAGISLLSLGALDWTVRRFFRPGARRVLGMAPLTALRLGVAAALLALAIRSGVDRLVPLLWLAAGLALPQTVVLLKLWGRALAAPPPQDGS